jgi:hypothetical protein
MAYLDPGNLSGDMGVGLSGIIIIIKNYKL